MALATTNPANEVVVGPVRMANVTGPNTVYAAAPITGKLVRAYSVLTGSITVADNTWTMAVNGVAVTGTASIAFNGSANGDVDDITYRSVGVSQGDTLSWISAGEATTTREADFYAVIKV